MWRYLEQRGELAAQLGHGRGGNQPPAQSSDGEVRAELTRQRDRMQSTVLRLRADLEHAEQTRRRESQQSRSELGALLGDVGYA